MAKASKEDDKLIKLTDEQVNEHIDEDHPDWFITDDGKYIATGIEFESFQQVADFMPDLAKFADKMGHHPDVFVYDYSFMQILLRTHDVDGFTMKDIDFINQFDKAFAAMDDDEDTAEDIEEVDDAETADSEEQLL